MREREIYNPNKAESIHKELPSVAKSSIEQNETDSLGESEKVFDALEAASAKTAEASLDTAKTIDASPLSANHKEELRGKLKRGFKKALRIFSFATALTGAAGMADYALTRHKVEPKPASDGEITYSHQDPETTHIINTLAGKESLSDSDKRDIILDYLTDELKSFHEEGQYEGISQTGLEKMPLDELMQTAREFVQVRGGNAYRLTDPKPDSFDPQVYQALWKLEQECGNPKVRFRLHSKKQFFGVYNTGTNFYNPYNNTVYLDIGSNEEVTDNFVAELSHGKQFNENPIASNVKAVKGIVKSAVGLLGQAREKLADASNPDPSIDKSYQTLYDQPGTLEYEAHKVIEPKLSAELDFLTPTRVGKQHAERQRREAVEQQARAEIKQIDMEEKQATGKVEMEYYKQLDKTKSDDEREKLRQQLADKAHKMHEDFQQKKSDVYKRYGLN